MTIVFFDTEFTDLHEPELLSVGIVTDACQELYVERLDADLEQRSSEFVKDTVLPMFGLVCGARAVSYVELATRTCDFLLGLDGPVRLIYDYSTDRELLEHALARAPRWPELHERVSWEFAPAAVYDSDVGASAMERVWREEEAHGLGRHHALSDARALRAASREVQAS